MKKKIEIKNKLINHIMVNGSKKTSEKILLKSLKELQKESTKQSQKIIQLALIQSTPTFKLHKISNKKRKKRNKKVREIPAFIPRQINRTSLAIKFILSSAVKKKLNNLNQKLTNEILLTAQSKSNSIELKNELQKQVLSKKRFFTYYRWK